MLENGQPLFCHVKEGPQYLSEKLATMYHVLKPIKEEIGIRIEEDFPGSFTEEDYTEVTWRGDIWSDSTLTFLESNVSLEVSLFSDMKTKLTNSSQSTYTDDPIVEYVLKNLLQFDPLQRCPLEFIAQDEFFYDRE